MLFFWKNKKKNRESKPKLSAKNGNGFREVFDKSAVGESVVSLDGRWLNVNQRLCDITGYSKKELLGSKFATITYPDDVKKSVSALKDLISGKISFVNLEKRYIHKNGKTVWVFLSITLMRDKDDKAKYLFVHTQDVTEFKKTEQQLRDIEKKYKTIIEKGGDGIIIVQDAFIKFANSRMLNLTGYTAEEIKEKPFLSFVAKNYVNLIKINYAKRLAGMKVEADYKVEILKKNGERMPVEISGSVIDYEGKPADMAFLRDITEREKKEEELRQYKFIFEQSNQQIAIADLDGKFVAVNESYAKNHGYKIEELIGKDILIVHPKGEILTVQNAVKDLIKKGNQSGEIIQMRKDKSTYVTFMDNFVLNINNKPKYIVGMAVDITKIKETEQELKEQKLLLENQNTFLSEANKAMVNLSEDLEQEKNKFEIAKINIEAIVTGIGDAVIATDNKGIINIINPEAEKMFEYKASEVIGKNISDVVLLYNETGEIISKNNRPFSIKPSDKKIINEIYYCLRKDKTRFIVAINSAPVILNGEIVGAVDVFRDVTKEREVDRAKTEFVSLASHQLRTPATAVKWYSEMLLDKKSGKLDEKQERYLNEIYHGNERMIKLIDNLLNISRIELGRMSARKELVDVKEILDDAVKEQDSEISAKNHKFTVTQVGKMEKILTDPILLRIIFQNLISNAIKYTLNGGEIVCTIKKDHSKLIFSIKDNGIGIPTAENKNIFEKFFRASNSLELYREGNGLGLYIVKQMARSLGGKIWFESEVNKGTTFYLVLPTEKELKLIK